MKEESRTFTYISVLISCCLMVGASLGLCFYSASVFYEPIAEALSLTSGQTSLITTFMLVFMALTALFVPYLMKKMRYRYLLVLGTILAAGGTMGMGFCFTAPWLYFFSSIQGIGAALIGMVPATTILNHWFYAHSAGITALATAMPPLVAALFSPLFGYCLTGLGWRMALVVESVSIVVLLLPALLLPFAPRPEVLKLEPYGIKDIQPEIKGKKGGKPMQMLAAIAGLSILSASLLGISQHFSVFAVSLDQTLVTGAKLFSICMIGNVVMKLIGGFLGDRIGAGMTSAVLDLVLLIVSIGMLITISVFNITALNILAFFYGSAYALAELSVPLLVKSQYGTARYTRIYALMNFLSTIMIAMSIAAVGFLYDAAGSFTMIWVMAILIEIVILVLDYLLIKEEKAAKAIRRAIQKVMPKVSQAAPAIGTAAKSDSEQAVQTASNPTGSASENEAGQSENQPEFDGPVTQTPEEMEAADMIYTAPEDEYNSNPVNPSQQRGQAGLANQTGSENSSQANTDANSVNNTNQDAHTSINTGASGNTGTGSDIQDENNPEEKLSQTQAIKKTILNKLSRKKKTADSDTANNAVDGLTQSAKRTESPQMSPINKTENKAPEYGRISPMGPIETNQDAMGSQTKSRVIRNKRYDPINPQIGEEESVQYLVQDSPNPDINPDTDPIPTWHEQTDGQNAGNQAGNQSGSGTGTGTGSAGVSTDTAGSAAANGNSAADNPAAASTKDQPEKRKPNFSS